MKDRTSALLDGAYKAIVRLFLRRHYAREAKRARQRLRATDAEYSALGLKRAELDTSRWYAMPTLNGDRLPRR